MLVAICCSCAPDALEPFWVNACEIDCTSVCCETPWDCAIELRLEPDCSRCCRALVLRPSVLETELSTFCQLLCADVDGRGEMLEPSMGLIDMNVLVSEDEV